MPPKKKKRRRNPVVEVSPHHDKHDGASVTYQRELIQCGKPKCKRWHGPYWYAYWTSGNRSRTLYIGRNLRAAAEVAKEKEKRDRAVRKLHVKRSPKTPTKKRVTRAGRAPVRVA